MTNSLCKSIFAAALILAASADAAQPSASPWKLTESTDEITDATSYYLYSTGTRIAAANYNPDLVIRIIPKGLTPAGGMKYKPEIMIRFDDADAVPRSGCNLTLRHDKREPVVETWIPSIGRHAIFSPDDMKTLRGLESSTNLTIRFTTTLGHIRTSTFAVGGLVDALKRVKTQYLKAAAK